MATIDFSEMCVQLTLFKVDAVNCCYKMRTEIYVFHGFASLCSLFG